MLKINYPFVPNGLFIIALQLLKASSAAAAAANSAEAKTDRFVEAKLRDLIQRQSKLIAELKRQCLLVADKLVGVTSVTYST